MCKAWRQDEIVPDRLKVAHVFHMWYNISYIMVMRKSKRKLMKASRVGCPVILFLLPGSIV